MEQKAVWNSTAAEYQRVFRQGQNDYNRRVLAFWEEKGLLRPGDRVLDVGCGVGKYAVLLAARGCDVTLLDSSEEMLRFAAENMAGVKTPWRTVLCDFRAPGGESALRERYDFVFSTMCPAVAGEEEIGRLSALTKGWCFVSRFASWSQPLRDRVLRGAGLEPESPHGGAEKSCAALYEAVRALGSVPFTVEQPYDWEDVRSPAEMAESLFNRLSPERKSDLAVRDRLLAAARRAADPDGLLRDAVFTTAFWLYWKV